MILGKVSSLENVNSKKGSDLPECVLTTLYVRHGLLMSLVPRNHDRETATALVNDFKSSFQKWQPSYMESVSSAAKVPDSALEFVNNDLRLGWEETTLVLDCPRLRISDGGSVFEIRTCIAVCTGKASSKVWTRVSVPVDIPGISPRVRMDQVPDLYPWFRDIADRSIGWAFDKIREILPKHLPDSRLDPKGILKATILGITDSDLAAPFDRLREEGVTAANVLQDTALDQKLTSYCRKVSAIDDMLSSYTEQTGIHKPIWFKMPLWTTLNGGEMAPRIVLFFMRDVKGFSEIIGFAYDDSERGDIALRAGAKMSKLIGPCI